MKDALTKKQMFEIVKIKNEGGNLYREIDPLGGPDSYFRPSGAVVHGKTARALIRKGALVAVYGGLTGDAPQSYRVAA